MARPPALSHLLSSNDPPQAQEIGVIENVVTVIDEEIEGLEAQLEKIRLKRQQYQSLLSPLRRMPLDVLGEIFSHTAGSEELESLKQTVTLCLVCKAWREAAYATHRLWRHIEIDATSGALSEWERVESWISRSGAAPKKLSVLSGIDTCAWPLRPRGLTSCALARSRLVGLLAKGSCSIDTLSISCGASQCIHWLCDAVAEACSGSSRPWDGIKSLSITVRQAWSEGPFGDELDDIPTDERFNAEEFRSFFKKLPQVTSFHLNTPSNSPMFRSGKVFPHISAPPSFLSHLTMLSIDNDWDGDAVIRVLQGCHQGNLEELTIGCKGGYVEHLTVYADDSEWIEGMCGNPDKMFVLPKLRVLRFRELHPFAFKLTMFFKAPSLTHLELGFYDRGVLEYPSDVDERDVEIIDEENMSSDVPLFIETSGCQASLERLTVHGSVKLGLDDLKDWLDKKLMPSLSHLTFDGVYLPAQFFDSLRASFPSIPLDHVKTIELLSLPTELHSLALYHRDIRRMAQGKRPYLPDTNAVITIKNKEG
ncbi:hypothetical protein NMY22_g5828 [Coprinellus aureogranulatus]|nr:hypothetical protein NMY22_g5828 [Coprinellus aureogranulatus]